MIYASIYVINYIKYVKQSGKNIIKYNKSTLEILLNTVIVFIKIQTPISDVQDANEMRSRMSGK